MCVIKRNGNENQDLLRTECTVSSFASSPDIGGEKKNDMNMIIINEYISRIIEKGRNMKYKRKQKQKKASEADGQIKPIQNLKKDTFSRFVWSVTFSLFLKMQKING